MSNQATMSCPGCGAHIGEVVKGGNNVFRLRIVWDKLTVELEGRGSVTCHKCGTVKEWYLDDWALEHLIERVRSVLRDGIGTKEE